MPPTIVSNRKLVRELVLVVVIKLILITALWWGFVRDAKVPVEAGSIASRFVATDSTKQQHTTDGEHDGQ